MVASSLSNREIKRLLARRHGFTPTEIAKLMLKEELIDALVAAENSASTTAATKAFEAEGGWLGLFSIDRWERWSQQNTRKNEGREASGERGYRGRIGWR